MKNGVPSSSCYSSKSGRCREVKVGLPVWNMIVRGFMSAYIAMGGALATVCSTGVMALMLR